MDATPRARRQRSSLTADEILDAAERVARADAPLTMRAVASELSSSPMALYRYFATKDDLVDAMLDRVFAQLAAPTPSGDWAVDLKAFARAHRRLLDNHPWAIIPIFSHPNPGANSIRTGEVALGILAGGGITGEDAVAAFSGILAINYGWAAFSIARPTVAEKDTADALAVSLATLPVDEFPHTVSVAASLGSYDTEERYESVLERFVVGLAQ